MLTKHVILCRLALSSPCESCASGDGIKWCEVFQFSRGMSSPTDIFKAMLEGFRLLRWPMLEASGYSLPHRSTLGPGHLGSCPVVCIYCTHSLVNSDLVIKLLLAHLQGGCSSQLHPNCCLFFFWMCTSQANPCWTDMACHKGASASTTSSCSLDEP